jgi:hypothetical protein
MTPLLLMAFNLGLKDYYIARVVTCGCLIGAITGLMMFVGFLVEKLRKKEKDNNLNLEDEFKFGICSVDNFRFFM